MKVHFKGKSGEYEIEKSHFCTHAFVVKDKINERDGVNFITSNVDFLEFSDEHFSFDEIIKFLETSSDENTIIVDEFFEKDERNLKEKDLNSQKNHLNQNENFPCNEEEKVCNKQEKFQLTLAEYYSRIFGKNLFVKYTKEFEKNESFELSNVEKLEFFKDLEESEQELCFVKIEILNYDDSCDSISFNLELFPSGVSYKYGIYKNILRIILLGKMQNSELFAFLKSFVYKSKDKIIGEKIFTLTLNQNPFYKLKIKFIA